MNIPLAFDPGRLQSVEFSFALDGSPSSSLVLSVGEDADGDGDLSPEEADWAFGYECGAWVRMDTATGTVAAGPAPTGGRISRTLEIGRRDMDARWNLAKLTRRGTGTLPESVSVSEESVRFVISVR